MTRAAVVERPDELDVQKLVRAARQALLALEERRGGGADKTCVCPSCEAIRALKDALPKPTETA